MGEDEGNCASCPSGTWKCSSNGRCLQLSLLCDEAPDCPDGEDESSFCPTPIITTPTTVLTGTTTPFTTISTPPPICVYNGTTYQVLCGYDFQQAIVYSTFFRNNTRLHQTEEIFANLYTLHFSHRLTLPFIESSNADPRIFSFTYTI